MRSMLFVLVLMYSVVLFCDLCSGIMAVQQFILCRKRKDTVYFTSEGCLSENVGLSNICYTVKQKIV